jgi:hypothetical protein
MAESLSPSEAAAQLGFSTWTITHYCRSHAGFGFKLGSRGWWRIPPAHVRRVLAGETAAEVAARPTVTPLDVPIKTASWLQEGADAPS